MSVSSVSSHGASPVDPGSSAPNLRSAGDSGDSSLTPTPTTAVRGSAPRDPLARMTPAQALVDAVTNDPHALVSERDARAIVQAALLAVRRADDPGAAFELHKENIAAARERLGSDSDARAILDDYERIGQSMLATLSASAGTSVDGTVGVSQPAAPLAEAELNARAARFIMIRSDEDLADTAGVDMVFHRLGSGNGGTPIYSFPGDAGLKLAQVAAIWAPNRPELVNFDPQEQMLICMHYTGDEDELDIGVVDRATGEATFAGSVNTVDFEHVMSRDQFEAILGPAVAYAESLAPDGTLTWGDYQLDRWKVIDKLLEGGTELELPDYDDVMDSLLAPPDGGPA